jgi:hypothetical protein
VDSLSIYLSALGSLSVRGVAEAVLDWYWLPGLLPYLGPNAVRG